MKFGIGSFLHDCERCCFANKPQCNDLNKGLKCFKSGRSDNKDVYFLEVKNG